MAALTTYLTLLVPALTLVGGLKIQTLQKNDEMCRKLAANPYFETDMVVGKPWRIYYTWNMKLENKCLDMVFKNATQMVVQRIWNDMYDYLEMQPAWDAATLHATMGRARHEILLFADQGGAGSFIAVPNVIRDGNISPMKAAVPLLKFQLKLLRQGQYLLMTDCRVGVSSLSARPTNTPSVADMIAATAQLGLGDGFPACVTDKNKDGLFLAK